MPVAVDVQHVENRLEGLFIVFDGGVVLEIFLKSKVKLTHHFLHEFSDLVLVENSVFVVVISLPNLVDV